MDSLSKWIISANSLWISIKKKNNICLTRTLNFFWTKSTKSISKSPTTEWKPGVQREEGQRREFTARQCWPGDPEADLRREICGLSVHMVTGVCKISNPIQPASLLSITISVKKKGAVRTRRSKVEDWQPASLHARHSKMSNVCV